LVLRAWERRYKLLEPVRAENGYRVYTTRDLAVVLRARELLEDGYRIGDIARMGREQLAPEGAVAKVGRRDVVDQDCFGGRAEIAWSILDSLPCGVFVTDTRGLVRWVNRGVLSLCGYDLADLHGRSPGSILQGADTDPRAIAHLRAAVADCRSCSVALLNYHRSGEPYTALVDVTPLGFGANHVGFVGLARRIDSLSAKRSGARKR
jgi:PAS domain S-box-containing protein